MSSSDISNIIPKNCVYGCNTKIYWNTLNSEYVEVLTNKKHFCPNRLIDKNRSGSATTTNNHISSKPSFYKNDRMNNYSSKNNYNYKKSWNNSKDKQTMDNTLEILQGSPLIITKQYEVLSDLIKEFNGKTHGSQSHTLPDNSLQIVVYYEVPEGTRDEIKRMFQSGTKNEMELPHQL